MIELFITNLLKSLLFPPGGILLLLLLGLLLLKYQYNWGKRLLWSGLALGYLFSTPLISGELLRSLESYPALSRAEVLNTEAQAIVILSAGRYLSAPEYGRDTVGDHSLVRIRYGAFLHHLTGLPVLVSGGRVLNDEGESLAAVMARTLGEEFAVQPIWQEDQSHTTLENGRFSQVILAEKKVDTILLVTHAVHMPRAVEVFEATGLKVIAAPTRFSIPSGHWLFAIIPSAGAIGDSYAAIHEWLGRLWYMLRY